MLTLTQLEKVCPSIFADSAHPKTSPGYRFIPTKETLCNFIEKGWEIQSGKQVNSRDAFNRQFAKHMVTLVHNSRGTTDSQLGSVRPSLSLINSHDHSSKWMLIMGMFRLICTNGLMVCTGDVWGISLRHDSDQNIQEITDKFHAHSDGILETARLWSLFNMSEDNKMRLAIKAKELRFGADSTLDPRSLLSARRPQDSGDNLWNVFNVIQENSMRGGIRFRGMSRRARELTNIGKITETNLGLWAEAAKIAAGN